MEACERSRHQFRGSEGSHCGRPAEDCRRMEALAEALCFDNVKSKGIKDSMICIRVVSAVATFAKDSGSWRERLVLRRVSELQML